MKKYIPQGLLTIVIDFEDKGDYALLQKVQIGMAEAVDFPLTDGGDVFKLLRIAKRLNRRTGLRQRETQTGAKTDTFSVI